MGQVCLSLTTFRPQAKYPASSFNIRAWTAKLKEVTDDLFFFILTITSYSIDKRKLEYPLRRFAKGLQSARPILHTGLLQ